MPIGSVLGDGSHTFTVTEAQRVLDLTGWNTAGLTLTPPPDHAGRMQLQLMATAIETATGSRATATQTLEIEVRAVADAPVLTLTPREARVSRELLTTHWEWWRDPGTPGPQYFDVPYMQGWSPVTDTGRWLSGIELWGSGGTAPNANGELITVQAATGSGDFVHLNDALTQGTESVGLLTGVHTENGAIYTLSLHYAGRPGLDIGKTRIGIYLDGQLLASYANTSGNDALNWQALTFQFMGNGAKRQLHIRLENTDGSVNGKGVLLDDIRIVETLPSGTAVVYGMQGSVIALPRIAAQLTDVDGSETLTVELLNLPQGATVSDGTRSVTIDNAGAALDLAGWDWNRLNLTPPVGFTGTTTLQVRATATDSNGSTASVTRDVVVKVLDGQAVTTPVDVNPYVSMVTGLGASAYTAGGETQQIVVSQPIVDASGTLSFTAAPLPTNRTWEEEEAADLERASALSDAWLQELEQAAQAHWSQLVGS
jgi:hypothetical protein